MSECKVDDCTSKVIARGWCRRHYNRWHRHGDTDLFNEIKPGTRFGRLEILGETDERRYNGRVYRAKCDCGNVVDVARLSLAQGKQSCGCLTYAGAAERMRKINEARSANPKPAKPRKPRAEKPRKPRNLDSAPKSSVTQDELEKLLREAKDAPADPQLELQRKLKADFLARHAA